MTTPLPALPDGVLSDVLDALGWADHQLVYAPALSAMRLVACQLDEFEHAARQSQGLGPVTDAFLLRCVGAGDPDFLTRPSPVRITGAIAVRRTWTAASGNLGGFVSFGARVAVLPRAVATRPSVAAQAIYHGFGVIAVENPGELIHPPACATAGERTWVHRQVEEIIYNALLQQARHPVPSAGIGRSAAG
ncbi:hypothetical protein ACIBG8_46815 [Nonomuraea sp. NPDC050556]|uniref:hypothetical protein n=1 Tax=Nonomuraea sp. NPDC050556 TaxID=3364369 RepID=UPI0037BBFA8E